MNILIVAATELEIYPLIKKTKAIQKQANVFFAESGNLSIYFLLSGVGMQATSYHLTKTLTLAPFSLVLHIGIAGAYSKKFTLGDCVRVDENIFADLGLLKSEKFYSLLDLKLISENELPYYKGKLLNHTLINNGSLEAMEGVKSNTVNCLSNCPTEIERRRLLADIETMEGGAVAYICNVEKIPFVEIRSISNYVGDTDKSHWNIPLAIENYCKIVEQSLEELQR